MAKNINIYKGNVYRVFAEDVKLEKGVLVPSINSELVDKDVEFYFFLRSFIKFNSDSVYVDRDEALDYVSFYIDNNKDKIIAMLDNEEISISDKKKFLKGLTGCRYIVPGNMKVDHTLTKSEFKQLKKKYKEEQKRK